MLHSYISLEGKRRSQLQGGGREERIGETSIIFDLCCSPQDSGFHSDFSGASSALYSHPDLYNYQSDSPQIQGEFSPLPANVNGNAEFSDFEINDSRISYSSEGDLYAPDFITRL